MLKPKNFRSSGLATALLDSLTFSRSYYRSLLTWRRAWWAWRSCGSAHYWARTAQANQIRGLLGEFGVVIPQGIAHIAKRLPEILEDGENGLPSTFRALLQRLGEQLKELNRQVGELEREIQLWHRENGASQKLADIPGIGPITASALVAQVGDAKQKGTPPSPFTHPSIGASGSVVRGIIGCVVDEDVEERLLVGPPREPGGALPGSRGRQEPGGGTSA